MTAKQVLKKLKALGDEKTRARHLKNGADDNLYGVLMGDLRKVAKEIKTNHELALELWETMNLEARLIAILVMKPKELSAAELQKMVRAAKFYWLADWLNSYVVKKHPKKEALREKWMTAKDPMVARAAWNLTAERVEKNAEGLDLGALLDRIEAEMGNAVSETQWTMNICLANIGIHHPKHRKRALAIGESLGVFRDYGTAKGCVSPFAPIWISEMVKRQKASKS